MNTFWNFLATVLGLAAEPKNLSFIQISLRGIIVMVAALMMIRLATKRSLAEKTAFDAVLLIVLASVLARAINGNAAFFPTLGGGFVLVFMHRLLGLMGSRWNAFGTLMKGQADVVIENGNVNWKVLRQNHISKYDLEEDLRLSAKIEDISAIRIARVERSGDISFIKANI
jgi:uncharacterized membrane protein YcaP (DUF421 family)